MYSLMINRGGIIILKSAIGYTNVLRNNCLDNNLSGTTELVINSDTPSGSSDTEGGFFETIADPIKSEIDINGFMESVTHAKR